MSYKELTDKIELEICIRKLEERLEILAEKDSHCNTLKNLSKSQLRDYIQKLEADSTETKFRLKT